jgi:hypothetical protein
MSIENPISAEENATAESADGILVGFAGCRELGARTNLAVTRP